MFIKEAMMKKLMKEAWKGVGLRVINNSNTIVLTGRRWYIEFFKEHMPKEILGHIYTLAGSLPELNAQFLANQEMNQEELYGTPTSDVDVYRNALEAQNDDNKVLASAIIIDDLWTQYRIYQDADGNTYPIPETYHSAISQTLCEENEEFYGAYVDEEDWIFYISSYSAFAVAPYESDLERSETYLKIKKMIRNEDAEIPETED